MSGVVDFRTQLEDENGNLMGVTGNPLVTSGGGGGGGSALADVLLTDSNGALFVSRDDGTTITYFNLNTNAVYTPVGTIFAPSGGGGGSALADVLLTDSNGALFVARDNGVTVTYFNLNTNAVYVPVGTILPAALTDAQLRASAVPVAVSSVTGELIEAIEALRMTVGSLSRTIGLSIPDLLGRQRVSIDVISGGLTLGTITTVGTVSTVSNQTQIGGFVAADQIPALMHMSADNLRANIKVT